MTKICKKTNKIENVPKGIEVRYHKDGSTSIRLFFMYRGARCRETLEHLTATRTHIKFAANRRAAILDAITKGTFDYAKEFPHSSLAKKFSAGISGDIPIKNLLDKYENRIKKQVAHSTDRGYQYSLKRLRSALGKILIKDLRPAHISEMIENMVQWDREAGQYIPLKAKTVQNHLIPLNDILQDAMANKQIAEDPMKHIFLKRILPAESFESGYVIKPFSKEEVNTIIHSLDKPETLAQKNMAQLWFFTGLRPSEIMALTWEDIRLQQKLMSINKAIVLKQLKKPKTKAGIREVMLLPPAIEALASQQPLTAHSHHKTVFLNPATGKPFIEDQQIWRWWKGALDNAGVEYRNAYQCRHTYASTLLSNGENMLWVATQMGHRDTEMITRVYGHWIPDGAETTGYKCVNDWGSFLK